MCLRAKLVLCFLESGRLATQGVASHYAMTFRTLRVKLVLWRVAAVPS